ncbi:hypothetical protein [Phenylobacterium sp.]|uniref:hypothetical protein n=1 Tax=Phenylobacterium sp. TaxID=1871053 RepID=UPI002CF33DC2|nr:hypothetical protein [Phenylobacterium sp.]HLZ75599.1 hypothetical protein [Phenylobacterium sp.]
MLKSALVALALFAAAPALAQAPAAAPTVQAVKILTVDSTLRELVVDPRTRPVIERHLPGFAARLESDRDAEGMFADVSLAGLEHDPHIQGMTPAALAKIGAELAEAQKAPPKT